MSRFCIICLLASLMSSVAQAGFSYSFGNNKQPDRNTGVTTNRPWGNIGVYKPAQQYEPPPAYGNAPYLGAAPATDWYSAQHPAAGSTGNTEPRVEVEPIDGGIYEQQNVLYTVRVISSENLKTLNPITPNIDGATLEQVDGPVASARQTGRSREIINEYHFKLMPLRAGEITIPPFRFTGTHIAGGQRNAMHGSPATRGGSFSITADKPLKVEAFSANSAVSPWLPLHSLKLRERLSEVGSVKAGEPVTLTLELSARGVLGNQLPSLQQQLQSDKFRVYRDSVTLSGGISKNGKHLLGSRKEIYTLIPLEDGHINLPHMAIAWWNVDTDTAMLAELAGYDATGSRAGNGSPVTAASQGMSSTWFWAPLFICAALIVGFWLGSWSRTRPLLSTAGAHLTAARQGLVQRARVAGSKVSLLPHINRLRLGLAVIMPKTVRLWMCTRCIEHEDNPAEWCAQFRNRICRHLGTAEHTPLPQLVEKLIAASPQAEPASMRELVHSLDGAIYGTRPLNFPAWKKELRNQLRPRLFRRTRTRRRQAKMLLPALNPHRA